MYEENFAVAILVVAAGQSSASGKRLPGPAVGTVRDRGDFTVTVTVVIKVDLPPPVHFLKFTNVFRI